MTAPPCDLGIVGAGVAGCALAAHLRQLGWRGSITLFETGRGVGGRSATRRSRHDANLRINHGAPLFNLLQPEALPLLQPLIEGGWIEPWTGAVASLDANAALGPAMDDPLLRGQLWQGGGGAMEQLCAGLVTLARQGGELNLMHQTLVRRIEVIRSREGLHWLLRDQAGGLLRQCRWLVLSGTLLAHPRCQQLLGWDAVPLQQAAAGLNDPELDQALSQLGRIAANPSLNLLLQLDGNCARSWLAQPWRLLQWSPAAQQRWPLRRLSIQPQTGGRCAVVAESTAAFAEAHLATVGSGSAAATTLHQQGEQQQEDAVLQELVAALEEALGLPTTGMRQLMRWGAAFPLPPGLPAESQLCPNTQIGFCGDAIDGMGMGRVEGALRSASALAQVLVQSYSPD